MKTRNLLTSLTLSATLAIATSAFAAESTFDRTLSTGGSPTLSVATGSGYIHLRPGTDSQIHVIGHVHGNHGWMSGGSTPSAVSIAQTCSR